MKQLDLGCGNSAAMAGHTRAGYECFGIDIYPFPNVKVADLAIEPIPYSNDSFDLVTAHQFLEHIPKVLYIPTSEVPKIILFETLDKRQPLIELFNEVYRVLKNGGEFHFDVPVAGTSQYYGDPTHASEWNEDSINYYSGDYFGMHDAYGHRSKFKKVRVERNPDHDWMLQVTLQAIKPCEPPFEVAA